MKTVETVRCPNCGNCAERYHLLSDQLVRTQCPACDYLMITCAATGRVIEAYAPGLHPAAVKLTGSEEKTFDSKKLPALSASVKLGSDQRIQSFTGKRPEHFAEELSK